ncbi:MAG: 4-phosphoerythronate dehydrogenase PdxB [Prolixibacteraceae bacterium]|nr:4-phosphoerythronate dehydrogenase PdxB [Prolixibacteraceae bacterium]
MKIIIDNKIPYIKGALEPFAEVVYLPGKDTSPEIVKDADAIITRTRTICNENLLEGSKVKIIATATIGYDHIDTKYCEAKGIDWTNAPGCNSWSVAQYIMAALYTLAQNKGFQLHKKTIGIVGAGNVGSKVAFLCQTIGMKVLINDPPRQRNEGQAGFVSLEKIKQQADIVTFHTPLTRSGNEKTFHLADTAFFENCSQKIAFINSSRGEVMDTQAVKIAKQNGKVSELIIDCWENEPNIDLELMNLAFITTPHIAGYSRDGKANGTSMSVKALSKKLNLGIDNWECKNVELPEEPIITINGANKTEQEIISQAVLHTYSIIDDSKRLKESPSTFEKQRGDYPVRREFPSYSIQATNVPDSTLNKLQIMGFNINE